MVIDYFSYKQCYHYKKKSQFNTVPELGKKKFMHSEILGTCFFALSNSLSIKIYFAKAKDAYFRVHFASPKTKLESKLLILSIYPKILEGAIEIMQRR